MAEFTQAAAFKNALFAAAQGLWAGSEVQVAFGHPGQTMLNDVVSFGEISSDQEPGPHGPQRSRDETLTLTVIVSIYRPGGPEMEQVASDRGYALLGQLENHVRKTDTTLGGVVRHCFMGGHASDGSSDPEILAAGRLITVAAQFIAAARIATT